MSLKSMVRKLIASVMVIYMITSNVLVTGINFSRVIAKEVISSNVTIQSQVQKYIPYENEVGKGVVLQEKVSIAQNSTAETYMPVEKVEMEIQVPSLKEVLPSRVSIITSNTLATNGKEKEEISQNYNAETGLLNIAYENTVNYNKYQENAKDEFEIIYIYPAEANTTEELEIIRTIKGKIEYKTETGTVTSESIEEIKATVQEKVGEITSYETISASEIYKGYMYANQNNKANHVTTYNTTGKISILNSEIVDETEVTLQASKYQSGEEEKETNTVVYKTSKIAEDEFKRIYGEEGYIDIYVGETKYASIKYEEIEGRKIYKTIYHVENAPENTEAGKVEYLDEISEVRIKTSKPQIEGTLKIENEKEIKAVADYGIKVGEIEKITEDNKVESIKKYKVEKEIVDENGEVILDEQGNVQKEEIEEIIYVTKKETKASIGLKEPTAQMKLEMSNINLSTLATNETKLTITLNDTNSSCTLYEAGQIEIDLPENLTNIKILNAQVLYGNGIEITNATRTDGKLILTVEGKQTSYDTENISGGVNIVIDLEIDIEDTVPSHQETLEVIYGKAQASAKVNIVSKYGVLLLNEIEDYNSKNKKAQTIDSSTKTLNIDLNAETKIIKQRINILNNYDADITSVEIIGRVGAQTKELISNFAVSFVETIKVVGAEAKVYYSDDVNAKAHDNTWSEKCTTSSRAYKIEIIGKTIKSKELLKIEYSLEIPRNLTYNKKNYLETDVIYTYANTQSVQKSIFVLATQEKDTSIIAVDNEKQNQLTVDQMENLKLSTLITAGDEVINSGDEVYEGQILRYTATLENISEDIISNVKIKSIIENAVYYEIRDTGVVYTIDENGNKLTATEYMAASSEDIIRNTEIFTLNKNEKITYEYQVVVNENIENIKSNIQIVDASNNDAVIIQKELSNSVKQAKISTELRYAVNEESKVYSNSNMNLVLNISSYENDLKNIKTEINLPEELSIESYELYGVNTDITIEVNEEGKVECTINKLEKNSKVKVILVCKTSSLDKETTSKDIKVTSKTTVGREHYNSNALIKTIHQAESGLIMDINKNFSEDEEIKENKELEYTVNLKNTGVFYLDELKVFLGLDKGLTIKKMYINEKEQKVLNNQNLETFLKLNINGEVNLKYILNLNINEADKEDNLNIEVNVDSGYLEKLSEQSVVKINKTVDEEPDDPENPPVNPPEDPTINPPAEETKYTISGYAWMDEDKDGKRDKKETLFSGIHVTLINKTTGEIVKDSQGNQKVVLTDENGRYSFTDLDKGSYLVMFEFDTEKYTVTTYQKSGIENTLTSDVTMNNITIEGKTKLVALTDYIEITDKDINNLNIGLIENAIFDLSLEKLIQSITVITPQGTKTTEYKNKDFVKLDLVARYMNDTDVIITYKFIIKNEGDTVGYVDKLVDNLPSGLEFSSELNKDWYKGTDGMLYTTSLSGIAIKPGATSEIELILTKTMTEENTGTFKNSAELIQISNLEAIQENEEALENNKSNADLVISIKTGSVAMYLGITLGCAAIIAAGAYIIKKKVLNRGI